MMELGVRTWGNAADGATVMLTGTYQLDGEVSRRLLRALPTLLVLPDDAWDSPLVALLADEIVKDDPGQEAVLDRLLDLLLIAVLRAWFARPEADAPAWYRAYGDPVVGRALRMLHHNPSHPWTVAALAADAGVSRAALARRFNELVGEPPMAFLTGWRIALAADLLREPGATIGSVADQVGYGSPFALSTAFKRVRGVSPREYRAGAIGGLTRRLAGRPAAQAVARRDPWPIVRARLCSAPDHGRSHDAKRRHDRPARHLPRADHMSFDVAPTLMSETAAHHLARVVPRTVFRIFVVEGQTAERSVLGQLIRRNPSLQIAGEARTAEQALAMLGGASAPPDIVCVSWLLDGGDEGRWAFVDEVRRRCPDARLMMTCPDERDDVLRGAREHGIEVLHSTRDSFHSLRRALHEAAQGQPYLSPRLRAAAQRDEAVAPHLQEIAEPRRRRRSPGPVRPDGRLSQPGDLRAPRGRVAHPRRRDRARTGLSRRSSARSPGSRPLRDNRSTGTHANPFRQGSLDTPWRSVCTEGLAAHPSAAGLRRRGDRRHAGDGGSRAPAGRPRAPGPGPDGARAQRRRARRLVTWRSLATRARRRRRPWPTGCRPTSRSTAACASCTSSACRAATCARSSGASARPTGRACSTAGHSRREPACRAPHRAAPSSLPPWAPGAGRHHAAHRQDERAGRRSSARGSAARFADDRPAAAVPPRLADAPDPAAVRGRRAGARRRAPRRGATARARPPLLRRRRRGRRHLAGALAGGVGARHAGLRPRGRSSGAA